MRAIAELRAVSKHYGSGEARVLALQEIDLRLHAGELTLIEGPSGCGKTTLLQILGLLLPPDRGEVFIAGTEWSRVSEKQRTQARRDHVSFVFQDFNLLESLTARQNVDVVAALHGAQAQARVAELISQVGLCKRADHLPAQLSGGQKQRVSIARALVGHPDVILADEPTANLDWASGESVAALLSKLAHEEGKAVVVVSHDQRLEAYADRVVSLADGKVVGERQQRAPVSTAAAPQSRRPHRRRPSLVIATAFVLLIALAAWSASRGLTRRSPQHAAPAPVSTPSTMPSVVAAAPAVVEPSSPVIYVGTDRPGVIVEIPRAAGDRVRRGDVLARLDDREDRAMLEVRKAELASAQAALADLKAWTRPEKVQEARSELDVARAKLRRAQADLNRITPAVEAAAASQADLDTAREAVAVCVAQVAQADATLALAQAGPTKTELARADAKVSEATAALSAARVNVERRQVTSPVDGTVVYRHMEIGETVLNESPTPILSVAPAGARRLRAEIDESDVGRVFVGQEVVATADAFPDRRFRGKVVKVEPIMGRRSVKTNRPQERQDTRVREVLIQLDDSASDVPIDMLVTARFFGASSAAGAQDAGGEESKP